MGRFSRGSQLGNQELKDQSSRRKKRLNDRKKDENRQKLRRIARRFLAILGAILACILIYQALLVRYDSSELREPYRSTVEDYLQSNILNQSKLFFSASELEESIKTNHPDIEEVTIDAPIIGRVSIDLGLKDATFIWLNGEERYIGDSNGIVFSQSSSGEELNLPQLLDESGVPVDIGDKVVSGSTLSYINELQRHLDKINLRPDSYRIPDASREIQVLIDGRDYYIKLSLDRSVVGQVDELSKTIKFITDNRIDVTKYIDIRIPDRAFYQ